MYDGDATFSFINCNPWLRAETHWQERSFVLIEEQKMIDKKMVAKFIQLSLFIFCFFTESPKLIPFYVLVSLIGEEKKL